jgi:hypothetical protein
LLAASGERIEAVVGYFAALSLLALLAALFTKETRGREL